jgi:hypothetical protein
MEQDKNNMIPDDSSENRGDLEPGRADRNLLSDTRSEAPIDKDMPTTQNKAAEAGDENYEDEGTEDRDYYEKRAGDNVRK